MRHRLAHRKLGRTTAHRRALRRNLAQSLFEHGQVTTTFAKAKEIRRFAEKLITLAKKAREGDLSCRRRIVRLLGDRAMIGGDNREQYELMSDAERAKVLRARSGRRHRRGDARAGMKFTAESIAERLIETVAARFEDRPGGYTRLIRLGRTRIGDNGAQAVVQLVGEEESPGTTTRPERSARRRRAERRREASGGGRPEADARRRAPKSQSEASEEAPAEAEDRTEEGQDAAEQ